MPKVSEEYIKNKISKINVKKIEMLDDLEKDFTSTTMST